MLKDLEIRFSEKQYCSDNAAMITLCALRRIQACRWKNSIKADPVLENASWRVK
jgi:tRNA A37 threonylcarbamoyltransferase TsaD